MYLKRLELQGFKSFADKTELKFMPGITTVIGPNGSGKSNIVDAIRWVLGEQSLKSLRGTKSEDIIFSGTQSRHSLGFAEVAIVIDNQDGKLPIEYSEVTVSRKIYRNGESGYFINKTPCRLKDVLELFMDTGIGKDGYSVIGQGKIDEILSNKSEDRRHIFEEAAGIVKYRVRKQESEKKLELTKINLIRINDILGEIEAKIEPLKQQSEKAKRFLNLREELKNIEIGLFMYNIQTLKERLEDIQRTTDIIVEQSTTEKSKLGELQEQKENLKREVENTINQIEDLQNVGLDSSKRREELNSEMNLAHEKIEHANSNYERYKEEIEETKVRISALEEEKNQKQEKKTKLYENKEKFQKELVEKETELAKVIEKLSTKEIEIEENKRIVEQNTEQKYEKLDLIHLQEANYESLEKREKTVKEEIRISISEIDGMKTTKEDSSKAFYELETDRTKMIAQREEANKNKKESIEIIKEYEDRINKLAYQYRLDDSRLKFLIETEKEKEGYNRTIKSLLKDCEKSAELGKGMHGVLADILSVRKEYELAIEMALGPNLQNIVTDTEEDAKRLVEHLRENNLGRASFLPISSIKGRKLERLIKNDMKGIIGVASDLIKADKKYEQIIFNLLGKTVIVDEMETAILLARQNNYAFKIVTLKGDVINSSGSITGGSIQAKTVSILGRKQEIEDLSMKTQEEKTEIEKIQKNKYEYEISIKNILKEAEEVEKKLQELEIIYATEKQKRESIEEHIRKEESHLERLKTERIQITEEKQNCLDRKKLIENEIRELEQEIANLNEIILKFVELNKDEQKYIDNLNLDITNLKISVSSFDESEISIDEMIERINIDIYNNQSAIQNKETQMNQIMQDNEVLKGKIDFIKTEIENVQIHVAQNAFKIDELKLLRTNKNDELNQTEQNMVDKLTIIDDLKNQISKSEVKKSKIEAELEQIINKMWEEYEVTPNSNIVFRKPDNVQETIKEVNKIRNEMKELGSINLDSIDEYKITKERYDFLCEQRLDLEESSNKLKKIIQDMTSIMKIQFSQQFKIINKNFGVTFAELFGGGKAELKLQDEEDILNCGIDIEAQPPGKRLQNMMLLSGGEKAFTAIALLFAILKINPAPFCVLDEIEAALDEVNVYRFADYLKKFTKTTQFLVITHRKGTMESADSVYGITMEENGISKLLSMKLK